MSKFTCICPFCEKTVGQTFSKEVEMVLVNGESYTSHRIMRRCSECNGEWENTHDPDWRPDYYSVLIPSLRAENKRLHARIKALKEHLDRAVKLANTAMGDVNSLTDDPDMIWDRYGELEVFRAALNEEDNEQDS